ncbi:AVPR1A [Mytilus coruscus]|uniref:AVPR1A n=1 Tax=Mytilus coruscus TaxID=42192 RepID=A0A6J8AZQ4_MYTCO|nr:AVPR1A [Mytilus coruscus]
MAVENITSMIDNFSLTSKNASIYSERNEDLALVEITVQCVIFCLAVIGNSTVLLTLWTRRRKLARVHLLMVHLSSADLFVAFCNVLPQICWDLTYVFIGGDFLCRFVKYIQVVAMYASSYVLVMTAIDRYVALIHPFIAHKWSSRKVHYMVAIAWSLSLLFSLPQIWIFAFAKRSDGQYDCWATFEPFWTLQLYITASTLLIYIIPILILIFCYGCICYTVWKRGRVGEPVPTSSGRSWSDAQLHRIEQNGSRSSLDRLNMNGTTKRPQIHHGISRAKIRTVQMTLTVVLCYLVCWSPFFIAQMWSAWDENAPFYGPAFTIILLLASLNSCTNPWIYLFFSDAAFDKVKSCLMPKKRTPFEIHVSTWRSNRSHFSSKYTSSLQ